MLGSGAPPAALLDETRTDFDSVARALFEDTHRMVAHLLGPGASPADVEDITQLVFEAAHKAWPRFRGEARVSTWMYGVAYRVVLRQLRSFGRQRKLRQALQAEGLLDNDPRTPEQTLTQRQEVLRVWRCLLQISPKKRAVYVMHDIEGRTADEIASILDVSRNTVGSRLRHARAELLDQLRKQTLREDIP